MISFIAKVKNLRGLVEPLLKSEPIGFHLKFRRTLFTQNILFTRSITKQEFNEEDLQICKNHANFGKIIELGDDFNAVKFEEIKKKKRGKQKLLEEEGNVNTKIEEEIVDSKSIEQSVSKKSNTHSGVKFDFSDLKKNVAVFRSIVFELKLKKNRKKNQEILIEGKRLIKDALSAGYKPKIIFYSRKEDVEKLQLPQDIKFYKLPYKTFNMWSDVVTSQGIIGIFDLPQISIFKNNPQPLPLTIICDNVKDPGNIGSILRVVAAAGCEKIILTKGCVDIWDPKVLRVGCGAHFRIPIIDNYLWSDIENEISENAKVFLADSNYSLSENAMEDGDLTNFRNVKFSKSLPTHCYYSLSCGEEGTVIIIGGETFGISNEAYKFTLSRKGSKIFIPMCNEIESLNNSMALGILIYEFKRQFDFIKRT